MPQDRIEIDPRKTNFLAHFHPEDRKTVIEWTTKHLKKADDLPSVEQLFKSLRGELNQGRTRDVYPYLRERLLFMFEARPEVINGWVAWCLEWHTLTLKEKVAAKQRFKKGKELWVRR